MKKLGDHTRFNLYGYIGSPSHINNAKEGGIKSGILSKQQLQKRIESYLLNPKLCKECKKSLPYENHKVKNFCTQSCAATFNNYKRLGINKDNRIPKKLQTPKSCYISYKNCIVCNSLFIIKAKRKATTCSRTCARLHPKIGGRKTYKKHKRIDSFGNEVTLDSTFEVRCVEILNQLSIKWIRPSFFYYVDVYNVKRRYTPDIFLVDYNLYLDPKNDYLAKIDSDKISRASFQNNVIIKILTENNLTKEYIKRLVDRLGNAPSPNCV